MEEALIRVKDLCKIYNPGENEVRALDQGSSYTCQWTILIWKLIRVSLLLLSDSQVRESLHL